MIGLERNGCPSQKSLRLKYLTVNPPAERPYLYLHEAFTSSICLDNTYMPCKKLISSQVKYRYHGAFSRKEMSAQKGFSCV